MPVRLMAIICPPQHSDNPDVRIVLGLHGILDPRLPIGKNLLDLAALALLLVEQTGADLHLASETEFELIEAATTKFLQACSVFAELWRDALNVFRAALAHAFAGLDDDGRQELLKIFKVALLFLVGVSLLVESSEFDDFGEFQCVGELITTEAHAKPTMDEGWLLRFGIRPETRKMASSGLRQPDRLRTGASWRPKAATTLSFTQPKAGCCSQSKVTLARRSLPSGSD